MMNTRLRLYNNIVVVLATLCYVLGVAAATYTLWLAVLLFPILMGISVAIILFSSDPQGHEPTVMPDEGQW